MIWALVLNRSVANIHMYERGAGIMDGFDFFHTTTCATMKEINDLSLQLLTLTMMTRRISR